MSKTNDHQKDIVNAFQETLPDAAIAALDVPANADPPLNPNHPNHKIAVPKNTLLKLCGFHSLQFTNPSRLPNTRACANPANPEAICTGVPPA